ncbi:PREDICTED: GDSL esterase/lipase At2g19060-like [Camelina sativa]|uniref:GDSL esterase/lipase At2g19060-like n=1 Tax=Camelina sativa TaxID=90675 RepID=A0ABM0XQN8_CAMSA|nr:PREDICTED: GDSL esterase/lipase At2g19060-like [Camelina sativa]
MAEGMFKPLMWAFATAFVMAEAVRGQEVPCYFVFGDSVFDTGNNNDLNSLAKVNYLPYGIDFARGPTGRFSNGRNIPDFIAELVRISYDIPPFTKASTEQAHTGINYASGGGGIREETSQHLGERISFEKQIANHQRMIVTANVPQEKLKKCLYTINIGSNDYLNNYFMPAPYTTNANFDFDQYADSLIQSYRSYLKSLYVLGARKVAVFGVSKLGCTPRMIASHGGGNGCAAEVNKAVEPFNEKLKALVYEFNRNFANAKFTFVDIFSGQNSIAYFALGFTVTDKSCCTVELGQELCAANKPVCPSRERYVYWDNVHSTEAANKVVAQSAFSGLITSPYSIFLLTI